MPRYYAFLRAVNVGGHTIKMDELRRVFESLGFADVETFIASGNVIFNANARNAETLEKKIEAALLKAFGYEVATFVRSDPELAAIATYRPFKQADLDAATSLNVGFFRGSLTDDGTRKLAALKTDVDDFHLSDHEVYWLCRLKQMESKVTASQLQKAMGTPYTFRNINTVRRMFAKYCKADG